MITSLRHLIDTLALYAMLTLLALLCLSWTLCALPLWILLPERLGSRCGRRAALIVCRLYLGLLRLVGAYRLDLRALEQLRDGPAALLAPNHPSLIDAVFIIAHAPNIACVMKSALMNNVFLAAGARLARYIRNEPPRRMIASACEELARGNSVLLFPEGTRTTQVPINPLTAGVGIIAKHAGAPVQTLIIEQDSAFLSKGWPLFKRPSLPISYRVRLGRRFDPPADVRVFTLELEQYFRTELAGASQNRWIEGRRVPPPAG